MLSVTWWLVEDPASEQRCLFWGLLFVNSLFHTVSPTTFILHKSRDCWSFRQLFCSILSLLGGDISLFSRHILFLFRCNVELDPNTGISVITGLCGYSSSSQQVFVGCTVLWLLHCWYIIDYVSERIRWDTWADTRRTAEGSSLSGWLIWFGVHTFGVAVWKFLDIVDFITHLSFLCICAGSGRV